MAGQPDVLLAQRQRLAGGDQHLLADEVEAGDNLGDRVLDLDARVHLHEAVVAVAVEQALDRPGRAVADGARGLDRDRADPLAERGVDRGRRRLLDELLVAALDRAVALAEVDHVPVRVGENLHLDVSRVLEVFLDVDRRVGEVGLALAPRGLERALDVVVLANDPKSLAAAAGRRLDRNRPAELVAEAAHRLGALDRLGRPRDDRHAGGPHPLARLGLRAHRLDRLGRRADPGEPGGLDRPREAGVLGEEAVAGMNRLGAGALRRLDQPLLAQVALGRRPGPTDASSATRTCSAARSASE